MRFGCRSRYISRYVNLKFGFLPFVVASIVAMVFLRRICSSRPGDGEQRGQSLAALTARGRGLDCLQPQPRQPVLRQNKLRIFRFRASTKAKDTQLASTRSSRAPCAFPNLRCCPRCWLFSCLGVYFHLRISPKEHQKERCGHSRPQRSFITFYGALRNILLSAGFPAMFHMIASEQMFVNNLSQKIFLADAASESNRFYQ